MSLRDALGAQVEIWEGYTSDSPDVAVGFELAAGKLREVLAAHPVEPAPVASRERVAEVLYLHDHRNPLVAPASWGKAMTLSRRQYLMRADALLAAGVFREPQRWVQIEDADDDDDTPWPSGLSADNTNLTPALEPQPVDREALALLLHNENCDCEILEPLGDYQPPHFLELREKHAAYYGSQADTVLALIGGDAK